MNITPLPLENELEAAQARLAAVGIDFAVVCSGPEATCPEWQVTRAA